jgi:hypothetical protein
MSGARSQIEWSFSYVRANFSTHWLLNDPGWLKNYLFGLEMSWFNLLQWRNTLELSSTAIWLPTGLRQLAVVRSSKGTDLETEKSPKRFQKNCRSEEVLSGFQPTPNPALAVSQRPASTVFPNSLPGRDLASNSLPAFLGPLWYWFGSNGIRLLWPICSKWLLIGNSLKILAHCY